MHPLFLGSQDENDVQGYPGTPVNVNSLMFDYRIDLGAAGAVFPRQKRFYVAVDSGTTCSGGKQYRAATCLRSWVNDVHAAQGAAPDDRRRGRTAARVARD